MSWMQPFELPPDKQRLHGKAIRVEWFTIGYMLTAVALLFLTLGSSQAMKAAWVEDILGLVPPIAFLVAARIRRRQPNRRFPYGYHRVVSIAFLCAALALVAMGLFILYDSAAKLIRFEHPPIGLVEPFEVGPVWLGWLMLGALAYSAIGTVILGRVKQPLAKELHDKVLYADAEMNRADWMTAGAAMLGVVGIGFGLWWADGVAATIISLDIVRDGFKNVGAAVSDLMDSHPTTVDESAPQSLPERIEADLRKLPWVADAQVRLREEGHVFMGEALVVPADEEDLVANLQRATERLLQLDWRLHDIVIAPVPKLDR